MKKKILLIEDDQIFANVYRNKLLLDGFEADVANDGESGLETLRRFRPDAIVLDLILPKMTGVDVIQIIRQDPDFKKLPIVVFSNTYLTNMVQDAWKAGATKCLAKSDCTPGQVIKSLHEILDGKGVAQLPALAILAEAGKATTPGAAEQAAAQDEDEEFQATLRKEFVDHWPVALTQLRSLLQNIVKAEGETLKLQQVHNLYRRIHALTGNASIVGMTQIAQMAAALEVLLKDLYDKPKNLNASTLRTVAAAVDFLGILFHAAPVGEAREYTVLVVDDDAISRRAITYSLEKARLQSVCVGDPVQALQMLLERQFDLIFLDVDMPVMDGYELCSRLRTLPAYKKTPVVFVTSLNDLDSRAYSSMSGGNDCIAKPFLFMDLAVKALVHVVRGRLEPANTAADPVPGRF